MAERSAGSFKANFYAPAVAWTPRGEPAPLLLCMSQCGSVLTRKPEELSRRQRKRHTKLLSRKEEFSGGS